MKGYRFYEEYSDKRRKRLGQSQGNCVALATDLPGYFRSHDDWCRDALAAVFYCADSPVCWGGVSVEWLQETCKRVSEVRARTVHPQLFERLDMAEV